MLTLLCTAPSSTVVTPVEDSFLPLPPPPPPASAGPSSSSSSNSSPTASSNGGGIGGIGRKLSIRRPSIRKRIQSLSRASGTSVDSGKTTLGNGNGGGVSAAAGGKSPFSFFRHTSASASASGSSGGHANAAASGSGSGPAYAHVRGASTSSFVSGKSSKGSSSGSSGGNIRLNVLNIGPPSAFRHQLHVGLEYTDKRTSDDARDETGQDDLDQDMVIIDVVPPTAIEPRTSTSSERYAVSHGYSRSVSASAVASSPNLLSFTGVATTMSTTNTSSSTNGATTVGTSGTPKQQKRASLVKRKPVPKIDLEDLVESPPSRAVSPILPNPTFVLVPDPVPALGQDGEKGVQQGGGEMALASAPPGKTRFEVLDPNQEGEDEETDAKVVDISVVKETEAPGQVKVSGEAKPEALAPEKICIFHAAQLGPAPTPPPRRRHTLAHMQARALGRSGTVPGGPRPLCGAAKLRVPTEEEKEEEKREGEERKERKTMEKEKKTRQRSRPRPRPVPIMAPSPVPSSSPAVQISAVPSPSPSPVAPLVPPGLAGEKRGEGASEEAKRTGSDSAPEPPHAPVAINSVVSADNSPRPSLSSLAPSSESDGSARSSSSSVESGDMDTEPRTPTDERRVSVGSSAYVKGSRIDNNGVRIVLPGEFPVSEAEDDEERVEEQETPRMLRRTSTASKRPNPPARRVHAKEESVYVTADEADDI